jgi:pSer/pThr/pTyr-binding forkhead associated (FHA) protein
LQRRSFLLSADEVLIGRRIPGGETAAAIDLRGPPEDEAVSRRHAVLRRAPDGSYSVTDLASTNGTRLNADAQALPPHVRMPLVDGDRVHVGAWTTITLRAAPPG